MPAEGPAGSGIPEPSGPTATITDGRRRKGERRRRLLLDATLRVVGRDGVTAVTQRAVAAEAGLPPSAVLYYFATVDDLLVAALTGINDRCLAAIGVAPDDRAGTLAALAAFISGFAHQDRALIVAEYELWLLAARRPALRGELDRWTAALDAVAARLTADPLRRVAFTAGVDGLLLRAATSENALDAATTAAVLEVLADR